MEEKYTEVEGKKSAPYLRLKLQESSLPGPGRLPRRLNLDGELMALELASARDWNELPRGR